MAITPSKCIFAYKGLHTEKLSIFLLYNTVHIFPLQVKINQLKEPQCPQKKAHGNGKIGCFCMYSRFFINHTTLLHLRRSIH
jgi:hypothetical protein